MSTNENTITAMCGDVDGDSRNPAITIELRPIEGGPFDGWFRAFIVADDPIEYPRWTGERLRCDVPLTVPARLDAAAEHAVPIDVVGCFEGDAGRAIAWHINEALDPSNPDCDAPEVSRAQAYLRDRLEVDADGRPVVFVPGSGRLTGVTAVG